VVDPRRVELGYDYCVKEECQQRCIQRVQLAAVGVNKAADYYTRADEVLPPPAPATKTSTDPEEPPQVRDRTPRPTPETKERPPRTTLERLRQEEVRLDEALNRSYERFRLGEITAREMDLERDQLIASFNRHVMSENIRYRSLLRRRSSRAR
jgi:hypothetical protein